MNLIKWLYPGMKVKRWLVLGLAGLFLVVSGIVLLIGYKWPGISDFFETASIFPGGLLPAGILGLFTGIVLIWLGLSRAFLSVVEPLDSGDRVVDMVFNRRQLQRGPKIVVIGGGTGLSTLLRGLKEYTSNLTAIVTVADDGGSSGRLRGDQGMLPPGDVRNCLVALADKEPFMEQLLQYRFPSGELAGHSMGNLLLAALNNISGSFDGAIKGLSRVLAVRGQVLPVTLEDVSLCAEMEDGEIVCGESRIPGTGKRIKRVFLKPETCSPVDEALKAISCADAVVLGPGSLYTSVLPNLLVKGMPGALAKSNAVKIYVCNVMTQPGETTGYTVSEHIKAIIDHAGPVVDWTLVNQEVIQGRPLTRYKKEGAAPVKIDEDEIAKLNVRLQKGDLLQEGDMVRHHPDRLARHIMHLVMLYRDNDERVIPLDVYGGRSRTEDKRVVTGP